MSVHPSDITVAQLCLARRGIQHQHGFFDAKQRVGDRNPRGRGQPCEKHQIGHSSDADQKRGGRYASQ